MFGRMHPDTRLTADPGGNMLSFEIPDASKPMESPISVAGRDQEHPRSTR
jgi:hypothetical protein